MMAPPIYNESRLRAKYHLQIEINDRAEVGQTPTDTPLFCRVRRVFRGEDLHIGDDVRFTVYVIGDLEEVDPDVEGFMYLSTLLAARYLEVFLEGEPPNLALTLSEFGVIQRPSDEPRLAVPTEAEVAAEWLDFNTRSRLGTWLLAQGRPLQWLLKLARSRYYYPANYS